MIALHLTVRRPIWSKQAVNPLGQGQGDLYTRRMDFRSLDGNPLLPRKILEEEVFEAGRERSRANAQLGAMPVRGGSGILGRSTNTT